MKWPNTLGWLFGLRRCNHSCLPNAAFAWDGHRQVGRLSAIKAIAAGVEVTFNYGARGSRARRRRRLQQRFNFECACELCSLSGDALRRSDAEEELRLWGALEEASDSEEDEPGSDRDPSVPSCVVCGASA